MNDATKRIVMNYENTKNSETHSAADNSDAEAFEVENFSNAIIILSFMESLINPPGSFLPPILIRLFVFLSKVIVLIFVLFFPEKFNFNSFVFPFLTPQNSNKLNLKLLCFFENPPRKIENAPVVDNLEFYIILKC